MLEIPGGPVAISGIAFSSHLKIDPDSWRLQAKPGGLATLKGEGLSRLDGRVWVEELGQAASGISAKKF